MDNKESMHEYDNGKEIDISKINLKSAKTLQDIQLSGSVSCVQIKETGASAL